jgi:beta-lactamase regulating signal transducer with metallopeptidase domain
VSPGLAALAAGWAALAVEAALRTALAWGALALLDLALERRGGRRASPAWPEVRLAAWSAVLCAPVLPPLGPALAPLERVERAASAATGGVAVLPALALAACALWLAGLLALELESGLRLARARRALLALRPAPAAVERRARAIARALGLRRVPALRLLPAGRSPLVVGLARAAIGLPADLCAPSRRRDLERALAHELAHLARRDPWISLGLTQLALLAWPLPWTWDALRRARLAQELACDQRVLRLAPEDRAGYRAFLLERALALVGEPPRRALALFGRPGAIRARVRALELPAAGGPRLRSAAALLALALGLLALCPGERPDPASPRAARPPGCLQLRFLVLGELAREQGLAPGAADASPTPPPDDRR